LTLYKGHVWLRKKFIPMVGWLLAIIVSATFFTSFQVNAVVGIDQENDMPRGPVANGQDWGQSFTPTVNRLAGIGLALNSVGNVNTYSVTVNVRNVWGGPIIGSATTNVPPGVRNDDVGEFTSFMFPTPLHLTPGILYVMEVDLDLYYHQDGTSDMISWYSTGGDTYPNGQAIQDGAVRDDDMAFRTIGMTEADFSLSLSPPELTVPIGSSQTSTITITSWFGFSSPVELSYSWFGNAPSDVAIGLSGPVTPPPDDNGTSTLQVSVGDTATTGAFILRITGTSGTLSHTVDVGVEITEAPTPTPSPTPTPTPTPTSTTLSPTPTVTPLVPGCIIATAAYGSELSGEVQFLRSFRDDKVMGTFAGSAFMKAFNAFYYSFSPQVARFISGSPALKASTRALLYPLMGALHLSYVLFNALSFTPEIAVVVAGFVASALLGALYLFPTASIVLFVLKRRGHAVNFNKAWRIGLVVVASLLAIAFAEVSGHVGLAVLATSLFVVSNIATVGLTLATNVVKSFSPLFTRVAHGVERKSSLPMGA
jgi:hypothetical protein